MASPNDTEKQLDALEPKSSGATSTMSSNSNTETDLSSISTTTSSSTSDDEGKEFKVNWYFKL